MAEVILMPRLSDTMQEGVIAGWHKKIGEEIHKGDLLADIETDKATMELESYKDGVLLYQGAAQGEKVPVNALLAILGKAGESVEDLIRQYQGGASSDTPASAAPAAVSEGTAESAAQPQPASLDLASLEEVVLMPRLSDTMQEGVIQKWHKKVGETVKKGDLLADVETDKATMELESYKDGVLLYQGASEGEKIAVKQLLCIIGNADFDIAPIVAAAKSGPTLDPKGPAAPVAANSGEVKTEILASSNSESDRLKVSPLARKIAQEKNINLQTVKGSGDNGRIVKRDLDQLEPVVVSSLPSAQIPGTPKLSAGYEDKPVSQMRGTIARRLSQSAFTSPHFYVTMKVNMDAVVSARAQLNAKQQEVKVSYNDIILKAVVHALRRHLDLNVSWHEDYIRYHNDINLGVAVAIPDGLLVPVLRMADQMSIAQISAQVKEMAAKAKAKKLQPSDWEGSTFTVSNLGMFGVDQFTALINPPDACILAIGGITEEPVVKDGQIVVGHTMKLTLSSDHRVVDGAQAAAFLKTLKDLLEEPLRMLL